MLVRDADGYKVDGRRVRRLSDLLSGARDFLNIPPWVLEAASDRGTDVHTATQLHDEGKELDPATITAEVRPYLDAYLKFLAEHQPQWSMIEQPLYHRLLDFACTPDRVGYVFDEFATCELKCTAELHPAFGLQTEGQAVAIEGNEGVRPKRFVIHLLRTGRFGVVEYKDALDQPTFRALVTLNNWKARHG